uniref:Tripartite motif-containing protein 2 n=1 Tax=Magallana gigas TaxID=29159 RepID=K1RI23_MAGGI
MAPTKNQTITMSEEEIPDTAQHYLVCGTEECKNNCQFYCNHCHRQLCEECTDEHKKGPENNNHEVVPYRQRKPQLPEEKCKLHQKRNVDIFCKDCNVPLCSKCIFMKEHSGHQFDDLEEKYAEKFAFCQNEISKIKNYFLSTTLDFKQEIKEDVTKLKDAMEDIRNSIKAEAESLKELIEKVREYTVPGVNNVHHMSLGKSGRLWAGDDKGNLVKTDLQGNQQKKIQTDGRHGYHTVTQDGDLIYTDRKNKVIKKIARDNTITEFIKTGDWEPISIYSSHINGDILVGMEKGVKAKVTRYNKTGKEIQNIQRDNKGQELYGTPHYITENINGDICTSDYNKRAVVVVNKSGQHRFSYAGQGSKFYPYGICTDLLGHILVCDLCFDIATVHLLNKDGHFLSFLLPKQVNSASVFVDNENNLHVGQYDTNKVKVYKYLQ